MAAQSTAAASASASAVRLSIGAHRLQSKSSLVFNLRPFAPQRRSLSFTPKRHILTCTALYQPELTIKEEDQPETLDYRVFFQDPSGKKVSPWHDIPLKLGDDAFNFNVEIPKETSTEMEVATDEPYTPIKQEETSAKMEVATDEPYTLIKQDTKKGKLNNKIEPIAAAAIMRAAKKEKATTSPRGNKINPHEILKYPLSTEAAVKSIEENNTYIFVVAKQADKKMIRAAMENLYGIKVLSVNTSITPKGTKKAFLKLSSRLELSL